jgi:hypothetical protein
MQFINKPIALFNSYFQKTNKIADKDTSINYFWLTAFTSICIFTICNVIVRNKDTFFNSLIIELISLVLISIYFYINSVTKSKEIGILSIIIIIISSVFINNIIYILLLLSLFSIYTIFKKTNFNYIKTSFIIAFFSSLTLIEFYNFLSPKPFTQYISIINGIGSIDTLYHASLAGMIKNYQTISTGLHGLVYTPYHALSHSIFAGLSAISKVSVIESTELVKWLLLVPLLIYSICSLCEKINSQANINENWLIIVITLVLLPLALDGWNVWNNYLNSDSYLLSLILLMIGIQRLLNKNLINYDYFYIFIILFLLFFAKGSTGAVYFIFTLYRLLMININVKKRLILFTCIAILISIIIYRYYINSISSINISFFNFIDQYSEINKKIKIYFDNNTIATLFSYILFYVMHFIMSFIVIFYYYKKIKNNLYFHFIIISLLIGFISVAILDVPGGSVYYISNISFFVSMPIFILILSRFNLMNLSKKFLFLILGILFMLTLKNVNDWEKYKVYLIEKNSNKDFIFSLLEIRDNTPLNTIVIADKEYIKKNIKAFEDWKCIPYIFTSLSERPWVNIFNTWNNCNYKYYSFGFYGVNHLNNIPIINFVDKKNSLYFFWPDERISIKKEE